MTPNRPPMPQPAPWRLRLSHIVAGAIQDAASGFADLVPPPEGLACVLLDDIGFHVYEHPVLAADEAPEGVSQGFHLTCRAPLGPCPLCRDLGPPSRAALFSAVFAYLSGNAVPAWKGLLHADQRSLAALARVREDRDLTWARLELLPGRRHELGMEDSLRLVGLASRADLAALTPPGQDPDSFVAPYDYERLLAPLSEEGLEALAPHIIRRPD